MRLQHQPRIILSPRLVWAYSTRFYKPDMILQECVPNFEQSVLMDIMSPSYTSKFMELSPCDVGFPATGKRQFGALVLSHLVHEPLDASVDVQTTFSGQAVAGGRDLHALDLILQSSKSMQDACMGAILERTSLFGMQIATTSWEDCLTPHERRRLGHAKQTSADNGYCQIDENGRCFDWTVPTAIVNLDVTEGFESTRVFRMPRLTKGSLLWCLVRERLLTPEEYWITMGWTIPDIVPHHAVKEFPHDLDTFPMAKQRTFMGNGMHVHSMGALSFWAMTAPKWTSGQTDAARGSKQ